MTTYRDAAGRFRKPTDDERWARFGPREREMLRSMKAQFDRGVAKWRQTDARQIADVQFVSGNVWPKEIRDARRS